MTDRHVVILFHHDQMRRGKTVMRVQCVYRDEAWASQQEATIWALRNMAPDAQWEVHPALDPVAAAPTALLKEDG